jgi:hypothetical protein
MATGHGDTAEPHGFLSLPTGLHKNWSPGFLDFIHSAYLDFFSLVVKHPEYKTYILHLVYSLRMN